MMVFTGGSKGKRRTTRTVSVKLKPATIAQLKAKARAEKRTAHAIMREAIVLAVAA